MTRIVTVRRLGCELEVVLDVECPDMSVGIEGGYVFGRIDEIWIRDPAEYRDETGRSMSLDGLLDALMVNGPEIAADAIAQALAEDADIY